MKLADAAALGLALDRTSGEPLARQLAEAWRRLILTGRVASGARLPSGRSLAADLRVSRSTVVEAFDQLAAEGFVEGRRGAGLFALARADVDGAQPKIGQSPRAAIYGAPRDDAPRPFEFGAAAPDITPVGEIARLVAKAWRRSDPRSLRFDDPFGRIDLRAAIAAHLAQWRNFAPDPERIAITAGLADALDIIARAGLAPGATAIVEEPGFPPLRYGLERLGVTVNPARVDDRGLDVAALDDDTRVGCVFVTPSRQFPLGHAMPVARRLELIEWCRRRGAIIVEDDFDSEYRYAGAPLPALASLDRSGSTLYLGSFSKVLFSGLRLGYLVLPEPLAASAREHLKCRGPTASTVAQAALAEFLLNGRYGAHIRRSRRLYGRRLAALLEAGRGFALDLAFGPADAGLHVVAHLSPDLAERVGDRALSRLFASAGVATRPLADFFAGAPDRSGLILSFSAFCEAEIEIAARTMTSALQL